MDFQESYGSYTEEKLFVTASVLYDCGYLYLLWKGALNDTHYSCIVPPKEYPESYWNTLKKSYNN